MKKLAYYAAVFYTLFILCMLAFSWYNMHQLKYFTQLNSQRLSFEMMVFFSAFVTVFMMLVMKDEGWME